MVTRTWTILAVVGLLATSCGEAPQRAAIQEGNEPDGPMQESELSIVARDFGFDTGGVASLPAGRVNFTMTNEGEQPHHAQFLRLADGVTFEQFRETVAANPAPANLDFSEELRELFIPPAAGVLSWVSPGEELTPVDELEAGTYALICAIKDPKSGTRHYELGMLQPFEAE
jgi:hypothetical protein